MPSLKKKKKRYFKSGYIGLDIVIPETGVTYGGQRTINPLHIENFSEITLNIFGGFTAM